MQTEMMTVIEELGAAELDRLERVRLENLRWEHWGREIGLLTPEQIKRANNPLWQWDDYSI